MAHREQSNADLIAIPHLLLSQFFASLQHIFTISLCILIHKFLSLAKQSGETFSFLHNRCLTALDKHFLNPC